jgi:hypothetical protein
MHRHLAEEHAAGIQRRNDFREETTVQVVMEDDQIEPVSTMRFWFYKEGVKNQRAALQERGLARRTRAR